MSGNSREPNWRKWHQMPEWRLWEAVALSLNIDPDKVKTNRNAWMGAAHPFAEKGDFSDRLEIVRRNIGRPGGIKPRISNMGRWYLATVEAVEFAAWARGAGWSTPDELAALANVVPTPSAQTVAIIEMAPRMITLGEAPWLTAQAIWPPLPEAERRRSITGFLGSDPASGRPVPALRFLADEPDRARVFEDAGLLPNPTFPMDPWTFRRYAKAVRDSAIVYRLRPFVRDASHEQGIRREVARRAHEERLALAVRDGKVRPLHPLTFLPLGGGENAGKATLLSFADFQQFAREVAIEVRPPAIAPEKESRTERTQARLWPWGGYQTERLLALAAAVENFWTDYVQGETRPHTTPGVAAWIREQYPNISSDLAMSIARIIRPDGAPSGRPKSGRRA